MKNKKLVVALIFIITIFILVISCFLYVNSYYKAIDVDNYLKSNKKVKVIIEDDYYLFDGEGENTALIFYQGGKVETKSYAPLLNKLASKGIDCYLMKMPFNLAILDIDKAEQVIETNNYDNWYIAGHSLGGVTASLYYNGEIDGYIFLAAYPNKEMDKPVLLIRGSNDGVLKMKGYNKSKNNWGHDYHEIIIKGGNHSNFGNYGLQKGDNKSTISRNKQQDQTVNEILLFINKH